MIHADGHTDRHDEANSRFSQVCESALKKKKASAVVNLRRLLNKADVLNGSQAEKSLFLSFIPSLFHFSVSNSDYTTNNQLDMICKKAVT